MKRYSIVALIFLVAAMLSYSIGTATAMQIHFKRDPKAVWASCGSSGGYGGYDGEAGVICIHPGCDGNPKHSCIVDCECRRQLHRH